MNLSDSWILIGNRMDSLEFQALRLRSLGSLYSRASVLYFRLFLYLEPFPSLASDPESLDLYLKRQFAHQTGKPIDSVFNAIHASQNVSSLETAPLH